MLEQSVAQWNDPPSPFLTNVSSPTPAVENSGSRFSPNPDFPNPHPVRRPLRDSDSSSSTSQGLPVISRSTTISGSLLIPTPPPPTISSERTSKYNRTAADFVRSDFWFRDGNVVIIAGQAAFKVHRGQLERHSEVFSGLFALPQPSLQDQELVDNCPCVVFHDSPSDVFYFLSALYDGLYFKFPRANDFPAIAAVLRLSTKYMVETLRVRCLHRLHLDWPTTLLGWDQREAAATDDSGRYLPRETCPHPILVIELALEMGISTVLPAALYDLSRYGPSKILVGTKRPVVAYDVITASKTSTALQATSPTVVQLVHPLLIKTLRGRESSQRYVATFLTKELCGRAPALDCLNKHDPLLQRHCLESFYYIMLNVLRSVGGIACGRDADPLFTLVQALEMLSRTDFTTADMKKCGLKMCTMCKVDFAGAVAKAREEVWNLLPSWFGLV
ncbi:hypothetical protein AGABI1DRAFT_80170 [Agaricus bisporus var. burnettii JB137-S8]|uniref:BTB domain-containing protein n=1 Tax=Agaricus bisporus var. burnettii (strain JB137-S8 / ATCC MYA-4627 / FGSC 10392) TaxID=597362 RepID=K5VLE1_AGABU|nr:uncharacterized protein AGABI1DRAFT_80170 [Agaricus bisporus var. burnettii JB137-S8]EKM75199.1 hypothetical protein AGABI1DRAFT_80170 [Agaricus bisporus var. burnettii JB137-S8]